uniref:Uncharacterized protein n=1 Tax=Anguilla anguilla TaxID=7936 RepID=A0A0E9XEC5_ANGAN
MHCGVTGLYLDWRPFNFASEKSSCAHPRLVRGSSCILRSSHPKSTDSIYCLVFT